MATSRRERLFLMLAALAIGAVLGDRFVIEPILAGWKSRSERIQQLQLSLQSGELLLARADSINDQWEQMLQRALPGDTAAAENILLTALGEWARTSGLNLSALKPRWVLDDAAGNRLEVRISAGGNLAQIARFLYELESDPLAIRLENVQVRARDERGAELVLEARLTGLALPEIAS